ncbi:hypothetical protein BJ170DRAFT_316129 [Xylariales sp. AK1849]|nr:hypothetical protein BJ170DRAFT_316129 [Xylariales sp. AK1849]
MGGHWIETMVGTSAEPVPFQSVRGLESILEWNRETPQPVNKLVHSLFVAQAHEHPSSTAISAWDGEMTYQDLDNLSTRLAGQLASLGAGPEVFIPVLFEKSKWAVVSLFAVLKSGSAFVLLDVSQPEGRLESMIRRTKATITLSSAAYFDTCKDWTAKVLSVDSGTFLGELDAFAGPYIKQPKTSNAAYVMFTSGTTGTPKGVVTEHSQISTHCVTLGAKVGFGRNTRTFQFASFAFDACLTDILGTLTHGGTVCIPSDRERTNMLESMKAMRVNTTFSTPSLAASVDIASVPTLHTLLVGGESVPVLLIQRLALSMKPYVVYGPTECAVSCFVHEHRAASIAGEIGRPFASRAWITKEGNPDELADVGAIGELLIEGPLVGRGYLDADEKAKACFIRSPRWTRNIPDGNRIGRLYRTGDLVRYVDAEGCVGYVGRTDTQVKIRGQRLELEEVESQLLICFSGIKGVALTHVVVETTTLPGSSSKQLFAFLQLNTGEAVSSLEMIQGSRATFSNEEGAQGRLAQILMEVESHLQAVLPPYAIPSYYIPMRQIPVAVSQKTDRKLLRHIVSSLSPTELRTFLAPSRDSHFSGYSKDSMSEKEVRLRSLWADVLGVDETHIGLNDNFFIRGDSLLAIKLVSVGKNADVDLTFEMIFKYPVLREMAQHMQVGASKDDRLTDMEPFSLLAGRDLNALRKEASKQCSIAEGEIGGIYPCTAMQTGLLALSLKDSGSYIMQTVYELPGDVDLEKLEAAWQSVTTRSPILRTRFFESDSEILQVVVNEAIEWQVIEGDLDRWLAAEKERGMKLGGRMVRFTVVRRGNKCRLIWMIHHSLIDGWSALNIVSRVEQVYLGQPPPELPVPDFAAFVDHVLRQDTAAAKTFWRKQLTDTPSQSFPPLPHPGYVSHADQVLEHHLPPVGESVMTPATMIQAAWAILLGIYSNTADVVTGVTLNGRTANIRGIESVDGPTITTVPFRTALTPTQRVSDFLQSIQSQYISILPFEQFGLQNIRDCSSDAEAACDFRCLLVVQSAQQLEEPGHIMTSGEYTFASLNQALVLECNLHPDKIVLRAIFDGHVLPNIQIQRMLTQLEHILHRIVSSDTSTKISDLQQIPDSDMTRILQWNDNGIKPDTVQSCVHELVEQRSRQYGKLPAVCAWDGQLNYETLDTVANRLARHLEMHYAVGPEALVALCFEKSKFVVVAMLAVLKAGGVCVLIDPKSPVGRLEAILGSFGADSANLMLTSESLHDQFGQIGGLRIIGINDKMINNLENHALRNRSSAPENAAFVVFTSGSTGVPKGIVLEHRAICSSYLSWGHYIGLGEHSRVFQFSAHTFDMSLGDIFATLFFGGTICIPSEIDRMDNLSGAIASLQANHLFLTPTMASQLRPADVPSLKTLLVGGENMPKGVYEAWADHVHLSQMYGPAECSVLCTGNIGVRKHDQTSDIGRGVGALTWIVDPHDYNRLMPIGGVGELLIEGPGLARRYLGDPAQTEAAFVHDPTWSKVKGSMGGRRFYKTGDLVTYNPKGSISFLGRNDGQIKLRGQRIEFAEVEHQLLQSIDGSSTVIAAAVYPKNTDMALAAFILVEDVPSDGAVGTGLLADSSNELDLFRKLTNGLELRLQSRLPIYMVPSFFIPIRTLPVSASGKVDRRKLQDLVSRLSAHEVSDFVGDKRIIKTPKPPSTQVQRRLVNLWEYLLGVNQIGVEDHFFRLGGHSVTAMRLVSMGRREGLTMTVREVFLNPVLQDLASTVELSLKKPCINAVLAPFTLLPSHETTDIIRQVVVQCGITSDQIEDIYPCSVMQTHYMNGWRTKAVGDPRNWQMQLVFSLPPSLDTTKYKSVWQSAVHRHQTLRTRLVKTSYGILQVVLTAEHDVWHHGSSLEQYLEEDRLQNMGYGDRSIRFAIIEPPSPSQQRLFVFTADHSIYDGFALSMLFHELDGAYGSGTISGPVPRMNRFIKYIMETDKTAAKDFWDSQLSSAVTKPLLSVPPDITLFHQSLKTVVIDSPKLKSFNVTLPTIIEVAAALAIAHYLGCPDVIWYSDRTGRNLPVDGIQDLIGPTTLFLPVRIHFDPQQKVQHLLDASQRFQRDMMPHEHLGFIELWRSGHMKPVLRDALNININPHRLSNLGQGTGLEVKAVEGNSDEAFGLNVDLSDNEVEWNMYYDERFIAEDVVERLMNDILSVFGKLVDPTYPLEDIAVAELFG